MTIQLTWDGEPIIFGGNVLWATDPYPKETEFRETEDYEETFQEGVD